MVHIQTVEELESLLGANLAQYDSRFEHQGIRLAEACGAIAAAIRAGHADAARIGMVVLLLDPGLPFGKLIKSGLARSLKRQCGLITPLEKGHFVLKAAELLSMEFCPREVEDYAKLVKAMGVDACTTLIAVARPTARKSSAIVASVREWSARDSGHLRLVAAPILR